MTQGYVSSLHTAKTLPSPIHFTPLHSLHANEQANQVSCKYTSDYPAQFHEHLTTFNRMIFWSRREFRRPRFQMVFKHCATPKYFGFSWSPFPPPTTALENSSTRCGSAQRKRQGETLYLHIYQTCRHFLAKTPVSQCISVYIRKITL